MAFFSYLEILATAGIPYIPWTPGETLYKDATPFWWFEGPPPSLETLVQEGCNCAGLMNLVFRFHRKEVLGTTVEYFEGLHTKVSLPQSLVDLEPGTLLLRPFTNVEDQGHVAIVIKGGMMIHAWPEKGVCREAIYENYFTHVCALKDWLG